MSTLKPCPFCGKMPEVADDGVCRCNNKSCSMAPYWYLPKYWNIRPIEDALKKRIAELEALVNVSEGLYERIYEQAARIAELERDVKWREESISTIEHALANNEDDIEMLESRIAELEAENIRLGIEYQRMRLALGNIAINSKRALNESPTDHLTVHSDIERQDDKWIPVSERLPDNWKSVLTIDISKSTRDMVTAFYNPETSLWSTHFSCDLWVTHWMPLPESPIMYGKVCEE